MDSASKMSQYEPPWGLQTPPQTQERKGVLRTTYTHVFQGLSGSPAKPIRHHTAEHFPSGAWRDKTSYAEQFYTPNRFSRHAVVPVSIHRKHKPHPSELIWPLEPHKQYMIWKPKLEPLMSCEEWKAKPPSITQFEKGGYFTTTYDTFFRGRPLITAKRSKPCTAPEGGERTGTSYNQRPATEDPRKKTTYKVDYPGDYGRPSTNAKIPDRSWLNIRY